RGHLRRPAAPRPPARPRLPLRGHRREPPHRRPGTAAHTHRPPQRRSRDGPHRATGVAGREPRPPGPRRPPQPAGGPGAGPAGRHNADLGMVRIERQEWRAESLDGQAIDAGTIVRVAEVRGTRVVVFPVELPTETDSGPGTDDGAPTSGT